MSTGDDRRRRRQGTGDSASLLLALATQELVPPTPSREAKRAVPAAAAAPAAPTKQRKTAQKPVPGTRGFGASYVEGYTAVKVPSESVNGCTDLAGSWEKYSLGSNKVVQCNVFLLADSRC